LDEEPHVEAVLDDPGNELRVRKSETRNTKYQIQHLSVHVSASFFGGSAVVLLYCESGATVVN
jgi:hypothetical protein